MPDCCQTYVDALATATDKINAQTQLDKCRLMEKQEPSDLYATLNDVDPTMYTTFTKCLQQRIIAADIPLLKLINEYETNKIDANTASEMNKNTSALYQTDLYYTIGKIFLFIILILAYFYFFNGIGLIEPIKTSIKSANDKISQFTNVPIK
jgi:hypothetical protein